MHTYVISRRLNCFGDKYSGILVKEKKKEMSLTPEQEGGQVEDTHLSFRKHPFLDSCTKTCQEQNLDLFHFK